MFDVAIIGAGPAGLSAALTLQALKKKIIWFGSSQLSPKIRAAEKIRNYPGLPSVSGEEMQKVFQKQIDDMGITITELTVTGVYPMEDKYSILCDQEMFEAKTVILCTGVETVKPVPGELEFVGKGVSYCATCDGFLYKGKTIAIECTSKDLEHEIEFLASLAEKVYLIPLYKNPEVKADNIEVILKKPKEITGEQKVRSVVFDDRSVEVDGVFMLKDAVAPSVLLRGVDTEGGHVVVDRACKTNLPGCFAAGDCTGRPYQYTKAVGEGNIAAHSAVEYLAQHKQETEIDLGEKPSLAVCLEAVDSAKLPNDEAVELAVRQRVTKGAIHLETIGDGTAQSGDVVTFSASGGEGRFNKPNLMLTLGQNLYSKEIEAGMVGRKIGDSYDDQAGEKTVQIQILDIRRRTETVLTDAMVAELGIEGVTNLEQMRAIVKEEMMTTAIQTITGEVIMKLLDYAPEEIPDEICQKLADLEGNFYEGHFKATMGKGISEMTPEERKEALGHDSWEEAAKERWQWYQMKAKQCMVIAEVLGLELTGEYDYLAKYETLGKLQLALLEALRKELTGGNAQ